MSVAATDAEGEEENQVLSDIDLAKYSIPLHLQQNLDWQRKRESSPTWWPGPNATKEFVEKHDAELATIKSSADQLRSVVSRTEEELWPLLDRLAVAAEGLGLDSSPISAYRMAAQHQIIGSVWRLPDGPVIDLLNRLKFKVRANWVDKTEPKTTSTLTTGFQVDYQFGGAIEAKAVVGNTAMSAIAESTPVPDQRAHGRWKWSDMRNLTWADLRKFTPEDISDLRRLAASLQNPRNQSKSACRGEMRIKGLSKWRTIY